MDILFNGRQGNSCGLQLDTLQQVGWSNGGSHLKSMSLYVRTKYKTHSMSCDLMHCVCMHTYTCTPENTYRANTQLTEHEGGSSTRPSVGSRSTTHVHTRLIVWYGSAVVAIPTLHSLLSLCSKYPFLVTFSPYIW